MVLKKSVLEGMRPRANIQKSGQIDDSTASKAIARSSRVKRTLSGSPRTARTATPASTAAVRKNCSASLGRSSGINLPRSMPPMNGCVARKTYAAHTGLRATNTNDAVIAVRPMKATSSKKMFTMRPTSLVAPRRFPNWRLDGSSGAPSAPCTAT